MVGSWSHSACNASSVDEGDSEKDQHRLSATDAGAESNTQRFWARCAQRQWGSRPDSAGPRRWARRPIPGSGPRSGPGSGPNREKRGRQ